jgi:hypothetical protein
MIRKIVLESPEKGAEVFFFFSSFSESIDKTKSVHNDNCCLLINDYHYKKKERNNTTRSFSSDIKGIRKQN